jgi:uncharacterized protein YecT (DUF1311 family)
MRLLILLSLLLLSPYSFAACDDNEGTRDSTLSKCLIPALSKAERAMNAQLKLLLTAIEKREATDKLETSNLLAHSQENWLKYRDQYCEAEGLALVGGMSSRSLPETECQIFLTKNRTSALMGLRKKISP